MTASTLIFLLVAFLDIISISSILPHLDIHAKELGFTHIQIGLVGAVFSGCQMISSPIVGSLSDVRGRKPILLLCLIICSFAYFWMGITSSIVTFVALRAVLGTFKQTQLLTQALAPDYIKDPKKLSVLYGRLMSSGALGLAIGPVISRLVMEAYPKSGFTIVCVSSATFFVINTGLISLLPDTSNEKEDKSGAAASAASILDSNIDTLKQSLTKFYIVDWSKYWDIFLLKFLITVAIGLYYSNFGLFLKNQHGISPLNLGYIIAFQGVIGSVSNNSIIVLVNKIYINDRDYSERIFHIFLVMTVSLIGLGVAPDVSIFIALLIPKAVSFALARIVTLEVMTNRSGADNRGSVIGASNSVRSVSDILTPIIGGFITQYLGVASAFYTGALFTAIGVVISYRVRTRSIKDKNM